MASATTPATLRVSVDGANAQPLRIERSTLYTVLDGDDYGEHLIEVETDQPGLSLFSATFG